jgi:hypothetical protein
VFVAVERVLHGFIWAIEVLIPAARFVERARFRLFFFFYRHTHPPYPCGLGTEPVHATASTNMIGASAQANAIFRTQHVP